MCILFQRSEKAGKYENLERLKCFTTDFSGPFQILKNTDCSIAKLAFANFYDVILNSSIYYWVLRRHYATVIGIGGLLR